MSAGEKVTPDPTDVLPEAPPWRPPTLWERLVYFIVLRTAWLAELIVFRLSVRGRENIPRKGPLIVVSNHASHADPPLVAVAVKSRRFAFMAKAELFRAGWFGKFLGWVGAFPVRRGMGDRSAIRYAREVLENGQTLLLFPEGTRSRDGSLGKPQSGIGMLIKQFPDATILPLYIEGSYQAWPPGKKFPAFRKVVIHIGKGFRTSELKVQTEVKKQLYREIGEEIMSKISNASRHS
jgi:1-acyl-sn-glycerol-3-phosphate acyltransferase